MCVHSHTDEANMDLRNTHSPRYNAIGYPMESYSAPRPGDKLILFRSNLGTYTEVTVEKVGRKWLECAGAYDRFSLITGMEDTDIGTPGELISADERDYRINTEILRQRLRDNGVSTADNICGRGVRVILRALQDAGLIKPEEGNNNGK